MRKNKNFKVFIPTAGIGSRLGKNTNFRNKALVDIGTVPAIERIIQSYPKYTEFVIALGYLATQVKNYLKIAHPELKFTFININPYCGESASLGVTLNQCRNKLNSPFIFHACDSIVKEKINFLKDNWIGLGQTLNPLNYRLLKTNEEGLEIISMKKGDGNSKKTYIGIAGIKDFKAFWNYFDKNWTESIQIGEIPALNSIIKFNNIKHVFFEWNDSGNLEQLKLLQDVYKDKKVNILPKIDESIWFLKNKSIKFFYNSKITKNRVKRASILSGFVPKITNLKNNFYSYNYVKGLPLSHTLNKENFAELLSFSKYFWKPVNLSKRQKIEFEKQCLKFYKDKTISRLLSFYDTFGVNKNIHKINGKSVPSSELIVDAMDWDYLMKGNPVRFHGDFHFENIIYTNQKKRKFIFLDWRQSFENLIDYGDIYYDLAKLLHGLIVPHQSVTSGNYKVVMSEGELSFDIKRPETYETCEQLFYDWCKTNGLETKKIKIICGLIFLNIAPLHHFPYCIFLYALGKEMLKDIK